MYKTLVRPHLEYATPYCHFAIIEYVCIFMDAILLFYYIQSYIFMGAILLLLLFCYYSICYIFCYYSICYIFMGAILLLLLFCYFSFVFSWMLFCHCYFAIIQCLYFRGCYFAIAILLLFSMFTFSWMLFCLYCYFAIQYVCISTNAILLVLLFAIFQCVF